MADTCPSRDHGLSAHPTSAGSDPSAVASRRSHEPSEQGVSSALSTRSPPAPPPAPRGSSRPGDKIGTSSLTSATPAATCRVSLEHVADGLQVLAVKQPLVDAAAATAHTRGTAHPSCISENTVTVSLAAAAIHSVPVPTSANGPADEAINDGYNMQAPRPCRRASPRDHGVRLPERHL